MQKKGKSFPVFRNVSIPCIEGNKEETKPAIEENNLERCLRKTSLGEKNERDEGQ